MVSSPERMDMSDGHAHESLIVSAPLVRVLYTSLTIKVL